MKKFLLYLWQLPQNLVGLILLMFLTNIITHTFKNITFYYSKTFKGGISLGNYIIVGSLDEKMVKHEFGHSIQSKYLGWLYLPIIGLPSLIWCILYGSIIKPTPNGYYKFWTERNADILGEVKRY